MTKFIKQPGPWLSYRAAGRTLGVSHQTIARLVDQGALSVLTLPGRHPRIQAVELDALIAAHRYTRPAVGAKQAG